METPTRASHLPMAEWRPRAPRSPGTAVWLAIDEQVPGADVYVGVISVPAGGLVPVHWHDEVGEVQFVLSGSGILLRADGEETRVGSQDLVFAPAGASGAHGFRNPSSIPLVVLFFYPSRGGVAPTTHFVDGAILD
jgi:mannose-6-phosphate isomerase-like protein (cupin superfamily)